MTEKQRPLACPPLRCRHSRLLAFSRRDTPQATAIEAEPLLSGLVALLRPAIGRHVAMRVQAAPDLPRLLADRAELEAVLINLVNNARDAMPDGGTVTLTAGPACVPETAEVPPGLAAGRYLRLSVADDGEGMSPEVLERVCEPFFTTKPARVRAPALALPWHVALPIGPAAA